MPSLESLRTRFRQNGGPANLSRDELERLWTHRKEMGLSEAETKVLRTAALLAGVIEL